MGFGQVHRARPDALDHLGQEHRLLLGRAVLDQGRHRAHGEPGIHGEREVGRGGEFLHHGVERHRQALAAEFLGRREAEPAAGDIGVVGGAEALGRGDAPVRMTPAALLVAREIGGRQRRLAQLRPLAQDGRDHVRRRVGEAGQVGVAGELEHVVEDEQRVRDGGLVDRHGSLPRMAWRTPNRIVHI